MMTLTAAEIISRLPHRHPFLMLDSVFDLQVGVSGSARKNISISDPVFTGHFPGEPIYPGVLQIESAAQLCGLVLAAVDDANRPRIGYLASVKRFKFTGLVRPGDSIVINAKAGTHISGMTEFAVELKVGARVVSSGTIVIALPAV